MEIIELQERTGYMYVNAGHRVVVYFGYCPNVDVHLWVLTPEAEALALEAQWIAEEEEKLIQQVEGDN